MQQKTIYIISGIALIFSIAIFTYFNQTKKQSLGTIGGEATSMHAGERFQAYSQWQNIRLRNPETGKIPAGIRKKELAYTATLPETTSDYNKTMQWIARGPYNVGGRTRGFGIDVEDSAHILAGGVSGGVWESEDGGATWEKCTDPNQLHSVTCMVQDKRAGKTNTWYYGTGEGYGSSASGTGAFFLGNGVYKSDDNGKTWYSLASTASETPHSFDEMFDIVWNIALDNSTDTADILYAATYGFVYRSLNGGETWTRVLGGGSINYSYFTDVATASDGVAYAALSSEGGEKGIYRTGNAGNSWVNILPDSFPSVYDRVVMGINPVNENEVYFLAVTPGYGQMSEAFFGAQEWNSLWKYTYVSGDGTNSGGIWENLSENIPNNGQTVFDNFYAQGSYNLLVAVHPQYDSIVFIGGTNLYRSTDGFTTKNNTMQIGGYAIATELPDFEVYPNHHPDQHQLFFSAENPSALYSACDGGVFRTNNCLKDTVEWVSLNNGYRTTQLHAINIDQYHESDFIIGGFQDNGNFVTYSDNPQSEWVMPLNGDGSYSAVAEDGTCYLSIQNGRTYKMTLDGTQGYATEFSRIDPIGAEGYQFINPFVLDPNDNNIMYLAAGTKLWRNDSLSYIPMQNTWDSISFGWFQMPDTVDFADAVISAVAVSSVPANIVYYGTSNRKLYKVLNANSTTPQTIDVTPSSFPGGNISSIYIDPDNANNVFVAFSNYTVYSLFYTNNGGNSWQKVAGNLEQNSNSMGAGNGPSCRSVAIMHLNNGDLYVVGTSTGLYVTDSLHGTETVWHQFAGSVIGNVVVEMIKVRQSDGLLVVGTHGNGLYSVHLSDINEVMNVSKPIAKQNKLNIYPNPATTSLTIDLPDNCMGGFIDVYDVSGKVVCSKKIQNTITNLYVKPLKQGVYIVAVRNDKKIYIERFIKR